MVIQSRPPGTVALPAPAEVSYPLEQAQRMASERSDLVAALRHQVLRNHAYSPGACSACEDADRLIAVPVGPAEAVRSDNPSCANCGAITQRTGACYTCTTCGTSTGCG